MAFINNICINGIVRYSLKNKVVHEGYYPKYPETSKAIAKANGFRFYVAGLVKKKKRKYSITYSKFFM